MKKGRKTQEEDTTKKLKSLILVDVKGMPGEIVSGITSAGYDILQDVFTEAALHLLQKNEMLKNMLTNLTQQVLHLQQEISALKELARSPVFPEKFQ